MSPAVLMFLGFVAVTLGITWWAARRNTGSSAYFAAGRSLKGWQNGLAVAGDYMSAASFLGIAGHDRVSRATTASCIPSAGSSRISPCC